MRILVTSDLHGRIDVYERFAQRLRDFDAGVIAGDLLQEYIPREELMRLLHLSPDDFLEELPSPDDTAGDRWDAWLASPQNAHVRRGLEVKERELKVVLGRAGRPVLVVPGNHDRTRLDSCGDFHNIHLRKLQLDGLVFVGYGWLGSDLDPERQMERFHEVEPLAGRNAVLVTHCPPFGTLDLMAGARGPRYRIGSGKLARAVERSRPLFHLFGHVHASAGAKGTSVNGAYPSIRHFFGLDTNTRRVWAEQ